MSHMVLTLIRISVQILAFRFLGWMLMVMVRAIYLEQNSRWNSGTMRVALTLLTEHGAQLQLVQPMWCKIMETWQDQGLC